MVTRLSAGWRNNRLACCCPYFLVTFTLPAELRSLAFAQQKKVYGLMMRCAAAALQKLALDPQYVGGRLGCLAVLHTWTRPMLYHPHVHLLVTGGGLSNDGKEWRPAKHSTYLMPVEALSGIFRAKFCAALKKAGLLGQVPRQVWKKDWVVHCKAAGQGRQVLNYLARYIFRVAITNARLERFENGQVTFRYRDNRSQQLRRQTVTGVEFRGWDNQVVCVRPKSHILSHPLNSSLPAAHAATRLRQGTLLRHLESCLSAATGAGAYSAGRSDLPRLA